MAPPSTCFARSVSRLRPPCRFAGVDPVELDGFMKKRFGIAGILLLLSLSGWGAAQDTIGVIAEAVKPEVADKLKLTDDQRTQIGQLLKRRESEMIGLGSNYASRHLISAKSCAMIFAMKQNVWATPFSMPSNVRNSSRFA